MYRQGQAQQTTKSCTKLSSLHTIKIMTHTHVLQGVCLKLPADGTGIVTAEKAGAHTTLNVIQPVNVKDAFKGKTVQEANRMAGPLTEVNIQKRYRPIRNA